MNVWKAGLCCSPTALNCCFTFSHGLWNVFLQLWPKAISITQAQSLSIYPNLVCHFHKYQTSCGHFNPGNALKMYMYCIVRSRRSGWTQVLEQCIHQADCATFRATMHTGPSLYQLAWWRQRFKISKHYFYTPILLTWE